MMSFYKLGIKSELVHALENQNILTPTPIQSLSIPSILAGQDLIGEAQTGTGKTLAFLLPVFQKISPEDPHIQCLIITPTRELAIQITSVAEKLAQAKPLNILPVYGGQDVQAQLYKLQGNIHIVIGTPGRILDHLRRGSIHFSDLQTLIVDEADQMFHIGFKPEVDDIISQLPQKRQTLCFSATMSHATDTFSKEYMMDPKNVQAPQRQVILENITQIVVETSNKNKFEDLKKIIRENYPDKAIIFCRSRRGTHELYEAMKAEGFAVEELHGALTQAKREFVMKSFREHSLQFLVATDVAARGLDVEGITHVFNYNLPDEPENYVHRIGRTGRAGLYGVSYTLLTVKDFRRLEAVEAFIAMKIHRIHLSHPQKTLIVSQNKRSGSSPKTTKK